jgi:acetyl esterase/lipase
MKNSGRYSFALLTDIDPAKIGFWGSSEGGMLATQVAAQISTGN